METFSPNHNIWNGARSDLNIFLDQRDSESQLKNEMENLQKKIDAVWKEYRPAYEKYLK